MKTLTKGFTMIELMITITLVAIVAAIAVPSFSNMISQNRLTSFSNEFVSTIALARNEALTRRAEVSISPKDGGTKWDSGWQITVGDTKLGEVLAATNMNITGSGTKIDITPKGALKGFTWGGITVCDKNITENCRKITMSGAGLVKVIKGS